MQSDRNQETTTIVSNENYRGDYFQITLKAPICAPLVKPGQFAHLQLPDEDGILLRRPFSIYNACADEQTLSIIYKTVGKGTAILSKMAAGQKVDILAPLGNGFPAPKPGQKVLVVAGGYGCAATYLIAKNYDNPGVCMIGGRSAGDILVEDRFEAEGYKVEISTNDGSRGHQGLVTELLKTELETSAGGDVVVYSCGPNAMLKAVGDICVPAGVETWLSVDEHMCCGIGACFACVVKLKADNADGWEYIRSCKVGPVFNADDIHWG